MSRSSRGPQPSTLIDACINTLAGMGSFARPHHAHQAEAFHPKVAHPRRHGGQVVAHHDSKSQPLGLVLITICQTQAKLLRLAVSRRHRARGPSDGHQRGAGPVALR